MHVIVLTFSVLNPHNLDRHTLTKHQDACASSEARWRLAPKCTESLNWCGVICECDQDDKERLIVNTNIIASYYVFFVASINSEFCL